MECLLSDDMVERMAAAAFKADWPKDDWERFKPGDYVRERYLNMQRAAIEAMREPTPKMLDATRGWNEPNNVWRMMIDAALAATKG